MNEMVRVLLALPQSLLRAALSEFLVSLGPVDVVGEAETGHEILDLATRLTPDVTIIDIRLRDGNGLEFTRTLVRQSPTTKVLLVGEFDDAVYHEEAARYGASAYLSKLAMIRDLWPTMASLVPSLSTRH